MLTKQEILDAVRYNSRQVGKLWGITELPELLREGISSEFVAWVCAYQARDGLGIDGKLGPNTLKVVKVKEEKEETKPIRTSAPPPSIIVNGKNPSNCIIINGKKVELPKTMVESGYVATNYLDDGEPRFSRRKRKSALKHFVEHETCGGSADGCKRTLKNKGYGVQLIMDPWGRISCHGDLVLDHMVHANQLNKSSFGIEVVNPYSPMYVRKSDEALWSKRIPRQWWTWVPRGAPRQYVCPTDDQIKSMKIFAPWVVEAVGLFSYDFPTVHRKKGSAKIKWPGSGVVAHTDFASHADGRYMLELLFAEKKSG